MRGKILKFASFGDGVVHGISTRLGGASAAPYATLNLAGRVGDDPEAVRHNRKAFLGLLGHRPESTVGVRQVHGNRVVIAGRDDAGRGLVPAAPPTEEADGLITRDAGIALLVLAADCVPILLWDPVRRVCGAVHAGWRGTVAGIVEEAVRSMGAAFGSRPEDLLAGVGPAIGRCCYEVDAAVAGPLEAEQPAIASRVLEPARRGHWMLDLPGANRLQLLEAGLSEGNLEVMDLCTSCHRDLLYSQRAEGYPCGRFGAVIALKESGPPARTG